MALKPKRLYIQLHWIHALKKKCAERRWTYLSEISYILKLHLMERKVTIIDLRLSRK
jgi:hypothetical protein